MEVRNGKNASFWHDKWSPIGCLLDVLGSGGCMMLGIPLNAKVEDCRHHRRKNHRFPLLNRVEVEIDKFKEQRMLEEDIYLWRNGNDKFKEKFVTKDTWHNIREKHQRCDWHKAIWFKHSMPKFSFIFWIAMQNRLSTGVRMAKWSVNVDTSCVFCQAPMESIQHIFFVCPFSAHIWEVLAKGILNARFTVVWSELTRLLIDEKQSVVRLFTIRYLLQATVHSIWMERNKRRHGEAASPPALLVKLIDKSMRKKFSIIQRKGDKRLSGGLQYWFYTRQE